MERLGRGFLATGISIYKGTLSFTDGNAKCNMGNIAAGLYLMQLTDSKRQVFSIKFVIDK